MSVRLMVRNCPLDRLAVMAAASVGLLCTGCVGHDTRVEPVNIIIQNGCDVAVLALADLAPDESGWEIQPGLEPVQPGAESEYTIPVDFSRPGSDLYVWVVASDATNWGSDPVKLPRSVLVKSGDGSFDTLKVEGDLCP